MKKLLYILMTMVLALATVHASAAPADNVADASTQSVSHDGESAAEQKAEEELDIKETIFEHLGDGYGWEVPFNHHKRIPLPVIVFGKDGLHIFSSGRVTDGQTYQDGSATFKIAKSGDNKGKIVEIVDGQEYKPFDISITKNVCAIFIACLIAIILVLKLARWHKNNPFKAPRKVTGAIDRKSVV